MAESLAFGRQCVGDMAGILDDGSIPDDHLRYIRFFHDQFDYYRDVRNVADVAVLYSYASMAFNNDLPAVSFILFTQALIQAKVPFDIIFDEHLQDLSRYRALVLADQECLDDEPDGFDSAVCESGRRRGGHGADLLVHAWAAAAARLRTDGFVRG